MRLLIVALILAFAPATHTAQAAETKEITMSCDGTVTDPLLTNDKPKPVEKIGVVVNLDERTVSFMGYVARINAIDAANISFGGKQPEPNSDFIATISGDIDRVTGSVEATIKPTDPSLSYFRTHYSLLCRLNNRLFWGQPAPALKHPARVSASGGVASRSRDFSMEIALLPVRTVSNLDGGVTDPDGCSSPVPLISWGPSSASHSRMESD